MTEAELNKAFEAARETLASADVDVPDLLNVGGRLIKVAAAADAEGIRYISSQRIAVVGDLTTEFVVRAVAAALAKEGVLAITYQSPYGAMWQELLNTESNLYKFEPDCVVIVPDWRAQLETLPLDVARREFEADILKRTSQFEHIWATLTNRGCRLIQQTFVRSGRNLGGPAERLAAGSVDNQIRCLNDELRRIGKGKIAWIEADELAERVGLGQWYDNAAYHAAKLPFRLRHMLDYVRLFRGAWRSVNGRTKKVLAIDLDNTLWRGVIGDDGVEGIVLGPGDAEGEAFSEWQEFLVQLHSRGVILTVCSKNNPDIARTAFKHAHMTLQEQHFAAFECSWQDKATSLRQIAKQLNVGLDSFVFVDDNPAECEQVRCELPEVEVVHLGDDPSQFVSIVDSGRWFDALEYTAEDLGRGAAYAARAKAAQEREGATNLTSFLADLKMKGSVRVARSSDVTRLAQMEQKTNQFNLTTRRYGASQILEFITRSDVAVLAIRLADKFGDHGLVSSVIATEHESDLVIESWLMSCRVFSRSLEEFVINYLVQEAQRRAKARILGRFEQTPKNHVVADLYAKLGFRPVAQGTWVLNVSDQTGQLETFINEDAPGAVIASAAE